MPATVWRALHIFTQVILFTTYEVVINYPPLVKYERDIPKKKMLIILPKVTKLVSREVDISNLGSLFQSLPSWSCDTQSQRLDVILIVIQTIKLEDKINIPFT